MFPCAPIIRIVLACIVPASLKVTLHGAGLLDAAATIFGAKLKPTYWARRFARATRSKPYTNARLLWPNKLWPAHEIYCGLLLP
jgi:hypothetical protein